MSEDVYLKSVEFIRSDGKNLVLEADELDGVGVSVLLHMGGEGSIYMRVDAPKWDSNHITKKIQEGFIL